MKERKELINSWIGRDVIELESHPYFSKLKVKNKNDTRIYSYGRPVLTKARGQVPDYWCENIFTLKEGRISKFEQLGTCDYEKEALPIGDLNK